MRSLKEMVVFPLLYPEVFEKFKVNPPRGVLFHGPPGLRYLLLHVHGSEIHYIALTDISLHTLDCKLVSAIGQRPIKFDVLYD